MPSTASPTRPATGPNKGPAPAAASLSPRARGRARSAPRAKAPADLVGSLTPHLYQPTAQRPLRAKMRHLLAETEVLPHAHAWAQLTFSLNGVCRLSTEDGTFIVPPSRAVWVPAGMAHSITVVEDANLHTLYLHQLIAPASAPWQRCVVIEVSELMRALVRQLDTLPDPLPPSAADSARLTGAPEEGTASAREALITPLLCDELQRAPQIRMGVPLPVAGQGDKRLRALCEAVLRSPGERATLAQWSASVGASERTVARLFRDELGLSYQQWRQQVTLAHALPLLARGLPVSQVASASGYASESAFSAMFRAAMGQAPRHFSGKHRPSA
ncbi:helix-turn-helix transcriptional regulator [Curvibacter sp. RS43]|uniref:Helix-turn-helix transcriptional regulator n=1 Tax=Curvibacter microcysteis TaxID=3026419 RepID=A0ABT5MK22_9BURK|nr:MULTISPECIES: helix-turn-helix transcriptional regulator [unclassified Curvibacter]MDD0810771.1 helix-turn-helix transcriptional regulator [Curvibacter sp. RS43]MDD0815491.1 helix-turn-helix transcriptional regulator [Curvibacter sp. HBC28]